MTSIRNNGDYRVCCHSNLSGDKGTLKDDQDNILNASDCSIDKTRNTPLLKELRKSMIEGRDHSVCVRCLREENINILSRRERERESASSFFNDEFISEVTSRDGTIDVEKFSINALDIRFGNRCNLKCRMCGPTDSDSWYNSYVELWEENSFDDSHGKVSLVKNKYGDYKTLANDYDWVDDNHFWKNFEDNVSQLTYIHIVGGEPFLIQKHFQVLKRCIELGQAPKMTLEYNTNGTFIPKDAFDLWSHFKSVKIGISVDGLGRVNDYIRFPSRWAQIEDTLQKIKSSDVKGISCWLSCTVQALNILDIDNLLKWKLKSRFHCINDEYFSKIISSHLLHSPRYLSVKVLPSEIKDKAKLKLLNLLEWFDNEYHDDEVPSSVRDKYRHNLKRMVDGYIDFMYSEDLFSTHGELFLATLTRLDEINNTPLEFYNPELYEMLSIYLQDLDKSSLQKKVLGNIFID